VVKNTSVEKGIDKLLQMFESTKNENNSVLNSMVWQKSKIKCTLHTYILYVTCVNSMFTKKDNLKLPQQCSKEDFSIKAFHFN
jgi:hypothetical protein